MKLSDLEKKRVLILGFGREGRDTFKFLRRLFPKKIIGIGDRLKIKDLRLKIKDKRVRLHLGENYLKALKDYDVLIKSPGIPFKILPKSVLPKITTQTEIFFENCPGKIVGVTGTKGKSTTSSLIYEILKSGAASSRRAKRAKTYLIGNIEKPVLSYLLKAKPDDVYVYELSSHQLYNLKKSPKVAVLLNIYQEHLDYYRNFKEYTDAKANIVRYQTKNDYLIYNSEDKIVREIARKSKAKKIPLNRCLNLKFKQGIPLINVTAAVAVGRIFGVSNKDIRKAVRNFKPLPHRLEYVGKFRGIEFYNDALATIPEATIGALELLGDKVETIMLGGYERNIDFKNLAKRILRTEIKNVILFPTTGERIWQEITKIYGGQSSVKLPRHFFVGNIPSFHVVKAKKVNFLLLPSLSLGKAKVEKNAKHSLMEKAVKLAYQHTKKGKICLLSTASPSFSIFKNYREKGDLFKKYVRKYGR